MENSVQVWSDKALQALCGAEAGRDFSFKDNTGRKLTGLQVRPTGNGSLSVRYRYHINKRKRVLTLGMYPELKMAALTSAYKNARAKKQLGIDPASEREEIRWAEDQARREAIAEEGRLSLSDLSETFLRRFQGLRNRKPSPKTLKEYTNHLDNFIKPKWGAYPVNDLPISKIVSELQRKAEKSPAQANRIQATLSVMFTWAVKNRMLDANPILGFDKRGGREESKTRALDFDDRLKEPNDAGEIRQFWNGMGEINPLHKYALKMILLTGQRPGEVLNARWDDFAENGVTKWVIPVTKNRRGVHKIPVTPMLQTLIYELKEISGDSVWLFPDKVGKKPITNNALAQRVRKELNNKESAFYSMKSWTPHDLRRTVATHLGIIGFLDAEIGMLLNHSNQGITAVYNQSEPVERIRVMLESWQNRLEAILEGKKSDNVVNMR